MNNRAQRSEMDEYWNESGGAKWVKNIEKIDALLAPVTDFLIQNFNLKSYKSILEIGCGGGDLSILVGEKAPVDCFVTGIDISEIILRLAKERASYSKNVNFICSDAESQAFSEDKYDLIFSRFGIMFFSNPVKAFANIRRSLKETGAFKFICWRSIHENLWMKTAAWAAFEVLERPEPPAVGQPGPFSLADENLIVSILNDSGFSIPKLERVDFLLNLGKILPAVELMTQLGPAATPFSEASPELQNSAKKRIFDALTPFEDQEGVKLPASCWYVTVQK